LLSFTNFLNERLKIKVKRYTIRFRLAIDDGTYVVNEEQYHGASVLAIRQTFWLNIHNRLPYALLYCVKAMEIVSITED
jgi:hypothetical protein